jgi:hypothetical protein
VINPYLYNKGQAMKAIEINSKTDKFGNLKIDYPLNKKDSKVRILILMDDDYLNLDGKYEHLIIALISSKISIFALFN